MENQQIIDRLYKSFLVGANKSFELKAFISQTKIDQLKTGIGYSSGQYHHRKSEALKQALKAIKYLSVCSSKSNTGGIGYNVFAKKQPVFPLRNKENQVVNFCRVDSFTFEERKMNENGVYPKYPDAKTQRLILAPNVLGAASVISRCDLQKTDSVLALENGMLTPQIEQIISSLKHLEEIVIIEETLKR